MLHAPLDQTVSVENAARIFSTAKHPKSFVSLDDADHLVSRPKDAAYAARVIAAWVERYLPGQDSDVAQLEAPEFVVVSETGAGKFQNTIISGQHRLLADEPHAVGGTGTGPTPYDYLSMALGACTTMTLRTYAEHKKLKLPRVSVEVSHGKVPVASCEDCGAILEGRMGKVDRFERVISLEGGDISPELRAKVLEIADKCPVHRTLEAGAAIVTRLE